MTNSKLVIFDLDGTLLNTIEDLGHAVNHALAGCGYPQHDMSEYPAMVGHGIRNLVINALPEAVKADDTVVDATLKAFVEWYTAHIDEHTKPYEGIVPLVNKLAAEGWAVAIASNKFQEGTEALVAEFFPGVRFAAVLGNKAGAPLKPSPEIVYTAMRGAGLEPGCGSKVVMVGDSATDLATAANAGIPSVGVTWGFRPAADLAAATVVVNSVAELEKALLGQ